MILKLPLKGRSCELPLEWDTWERPCSVGCENGVLKMGLLWIR